MSDEKAEATEKPLEKLTVKALREIAKDIPEITGVHGMKKEELIVAINEARGVEEEAVKPTKSAKAKSAPKVGVTLGEIKKQIRALKSHRAAALESQDKKMAQVYKRRIARLKKKSRKAAALSAAQ
ncbi:MAG: Rho termination factor N-terminal domain-containing protein [Deltaproteobacteria bacterium]|jgi:hypothetical protein|nr:Rho termination factor N-terminal domain-containing protein [Deltaproteobacteria bacterium]